MSTRRQKPGTRNRKLGKVTDTPPGAPRTQKVRNRREALLTVIRTRGLVRFDVRAFAREWKCGKSVVYEDLKAIASEISTQAVDVVVLSALERLRRADEEYLAILEEARQDTRKIEQRDGTVVEVAAIPESVRLGAANALRDSAKAEIETLQRLGLLKDHGPGSESNPLSVKVAADALLKRLFPDEEGA